MNREERIAAKVASGDVLERARRMISSGGRGIELGIRDIDGLARAYANAYKAMRQVQSSKGNWEEEDTKKELLAILDSI